MEDEVIWNDDKTMCFLANQFQAARITYPFYEGEIKKGTHWVRVHLKGTNLGDVSRNAGLKYATCKSEEEAKECLARLIAKLALAGVIKEPKNSRGDRFDHVELQEEDDGG